MVASEQQNIIFGNECLISFGIFVRTADPHLIYDCETKKRINSSKSVLVGDHVWIGQGALILKGNVIGSGSIIGGGSVLSNKRIPSNVSAAGNPAKIIKEGIFFNDKCVHSWKEEQTQQYAVMDTDEWIYEKDENTVSLNDIDIALKLKSNAEERLEEVKKYLVNYTHKNRFFIEPIEVKKKKRFFNKH